MPANLTPNRNEPSTAAGVNESALVQPTPDSLPSAPTILTNGSTETSQTGDEEEKYVSAETSQLGDEQDIEASSTSSLNNVSRTSFEKILLISPSQSKIWFLKQLMED